MAAIAVVASSSKLAQWRAVFVHIYRFPRGRGVLLSRAGIGKGNPQLCWRDVLLPTAIRRTFPLVIADVEDAGGMLHHVGHFILFGIFVDLKEPR